MLTCYHSFPNFANKNRWAEYCVSNNGKPPDGSNCATSTEHGSGYQDRYLVYPDALDASSPWGWFIAYLFSRYLKGAPTNASGPRQQQSGDPASVQYGNSAGAYIDFLQPMNEPNAFWRPQVNSNGVDRTVLYCNVASALKTAVAISAFYVSRSGFPYTGAQVLAPGVAQVTPNNTAQTNYGDFTKGVLQNLQNWTPEAYVGWAMHNYMDITQGITTGVTDIQALLSQYGWRDGRNVWLTEGGFKFGVTAPTPPSVVWTVDGGERGNQTYSQDRLIQQNFSSMKANGAVKMFTQYLIHDAPTASFQSSLRGQALCNAAGLPTAVRPTPDEAYNTWPTLDAS